MHQSVARYAVLVPAFMLEYIHQRRGAALETSTRHRGIRFYKTWIDHREAIIVVLTEKGEETKRIESTVEKQLRRSGGVRPAIRW
jgi:hypothetical protein